MTETANQRRGRNNKNRGKALERRVAKLLAALHQVNTAERVTDQGRSYPDIHFEGFCPLCGGEDREYVVEVKSRQQGTPTYLIEAWEQATRGAGLTDREPFVILTYVDDGRRVFWLVKQMAEEKEERK